MTRKHFQIFCHHIEAEWSINMTSRELTILAIERKNPPRYPILHFNRNVEKGDVVGAGYEPASDFHSDIQGMTEWGFTWEHVDDTMGQPKDYPIKEYSDLESYAFPDPAADGRLALIEAMQKKYPDKFLIAGLGISGFNLVTFLRGFENTLTDLYTDTEQILGLTDKVMGFENALIHRFAGLKADAVGFGDDWGTQNALMISPQLWREYFKPRYKKQFDLAHELGMYVYFHSCGYILDILPDFIEIGVDVINLNQPDLFGVEKLGEEFAGKICFNCPVDHQTTAIHGTDKDIESYILRMKNNLSKNGGGYMGYIEDYPSLGMTSRTYDQLEETFYRHRKY